MQPDNGKIIKTVVTALPRPPSLILGGLLLREGRGEEWRGGEGTPYSPVTPPATTF